MDEYDRALGVRVAQLVVGDAIGKLDEGALRILATKLAQSPGFVAIRKGHLLRRTRVSLQIGRIKSSTLLLIGFNTRK